MTKTRIVDNRNRPAQPEPGEDEAVEKPPSLRESEQGKQERNADARETPRRRSD